MSTAIKHHDAGDLLLAVSDTGWRLERKDSRRRDVWFLFRVVSADGLIVFRGRLRRHTLWPLAALWGSGLT